MANPRKKFSKIYDRYIDKIYRFIFLKVDSREIAEDLCSETFLRTWEILKEKNPGIDNVQAFLYKVARNLVIDYYRKKARPEIVPAQNVQLLDTKVDLEKQALLNSDIKQIKQSIARLKDDYQNVLIWRYLDEMSIKEIGQMLDRTKNATRVLLHRALKALRKEAQ